jgi:hypothetical protein
VRLQLAAGAGLALAAALRLVAALQQVPNRHAFVWDAARRAVLDVQAADALRRLDPFSFAWWVAGPETWPTLRLTFAAALHALAGPARALAVEHGLSIAVTAGLALALALAVRSVAPRRADALVALALAAGALAGNRLLLVHAANGMLEPLAALCTLGATAAWVVARERDDARPWAVALLGNLLFHVKFQYGLLFAAAVLALEVCDGGARAALDRAGAAGRALLAGLRTRSGAALAAAAVALVAVAAAVKLTGGLEGRVAGVRLVLREVHGPAALAALAAFACVQGALWRARGRLGAIPERLRWLWAWLVAPMVAWLLVPFTWRLRTLAQTAGSFDSGQAPMGLVQRLAFYPRSALELWASSPSWIVTGALLAASVVAAARSPEVRRRLAPILAVVVVEWLGLTLLTRHNYQPRFAVNLAPLVALAAVAWVPALAWRPVRLALAAAAATVLAFQAAPAWRTGSLAATMANGFDPVEAGDTCRAVARAVPASRAVLVNLTPLSHRQGCAMWVEFVARERRAEVDVYAYGPRPGWDEAIVLAGGCDHLPALAGFVPSGPPAEAGPVCGRRYVREPER